MNSKHMLVRMLMLTLTAVLPMLAMENSAVGVKDSVGVQARYGEDEEKYAADQSQHMAAGVEHLDVAKLLLEGQADVHSVGVADGNKIALQKAFDRGDYATVQLLTFFGSQHPNITTDSLDQKIKKFNDVASQLRQLIPVGHPHYQFEAHLRPLYLAEQLEKLQKDLEAVRTGLTLLGEQNWLPEVLVESQILQNYMPVPLAQSVDAYATQYVSKDHDALLDKLIKGHIERVQWLQSRGLDLSQTGSYEPGVVLRMQLEEKKKDEESEAKKCSEQEKE